MIDDSKAGVKDVFVLHSHQINNIIQNVYYFKNGFIILHNV